MILVNFISESGKIPVAYRPCEEVTDARTEEEQQDLIQVCGDKNSRGYTASVAIIQNNQQDLEDFGMSTQLCQPSENVKL